MILLTTFQVLFEISGIIVTIFCPPCRGLVQLGDLASDNATLFAGGSWGDSPTIYKDYSHIASFPLSIYVLPHIFSGVVPRMVDGFKCITANEIVMENMAEWEKFVGSVKDDPREHIIMALSEAYFKHPEALKNLEKKMDESLALRRYAIYGVCKIFA